MGPFILGIVFLLVAYLAPLPPPFSTILLIAGIILVLYGVWVLIVGRSYGPPPPSGPRSRTRWY